MDKFKAVCSIPIIIALYIMIISVDVVKLIFICFTAICILPFYLFVNFKKNTHG